MQTYIDLLQRNPNYRNLWLAKLISFLGDWFNLLASAALIASLTGATTAISYLFLARFLPLFFVSPFAGVVADRFSRRQIMIASDLLRAATVLCFLFIRSPSQIWLFYTLTALQFTLSAFFTPAQTALLPNVVEKDDLVTANALDGFTWSSMLAIGSLLGGLAAGFLGITAAFVLDAATFILSAWFVTRINMPQATAEERIRQAAGGSGFFQFVDGMRYLQGRPFILVLALAKASGSLVWGAINVLEIPMAEKLFPLTIFQGANAGTLTLSLIYAVTGLGTGFGPLFMRRWLGDDRETMLRTIGLSFGILTLGLLGLGLAPNLGWVLVATLLRAIGTGAIWVFSAALLQMLVEDRFRGRVFAFEFAALTLTQSISTLWAGFAQDQLGLGIQQVLLVTGGFCVVVGLVWMAAQVRTAKLAIAPAGD